LNLNPKLNLNTNRNKNTLSIALVENKDIIKNEKKSLIDKHQENNNIINVFKSYKNSELSIIKETTLIIKPTKKSKYHKTFQLFEEYNSNSKKFTKEKDENNILTKNSLINSSSNLRNLLSTFNNFNSKSDNNINNNTNLNTKFPLKIKKDKNFSSQMNFNIIEKEIFETFSEKLLEENKTKKISDKKNYEEIKDFLNEFGMDKNKFKKEMDKKQELKSLLNFYENKFRGPNENETKNGYRNFEEDKDNKNININNNNNSKILMGNTSKENLINNSKQKNILKIKTFGSIIKFNKFVIKREIRFSFFCISDKDKNDVSYDNDIEDSFDFGYFFINKGYDKNKNLIRNNFNKNLNMINRLDFSNVKNLLNLNNLNINNNHYNNNINKNKLDNNKISNKSIDNTFNLSNKRSNFIFCNNIIYLFNKIYNVILK
jgi:hypothetical protein